MIYLPDTNACITLLRQSNPKLLSRWQSTRMSDIVMCSVVVYELRYGASRCTHPEREHTRLDAFLAPYDSLPFDDACAFQCAAIRRDLERRGLVIGPHDLQIAATALQFGLTLVTHNSNEFARVERLRLVDWEI